MNNLENLIKDAPRITEDQWYAVVLFGDTTGIDLSFAKLEQPGRNVLVAKHEIENYPQLNLDLDLGQYSLIPNIDDDSNVFYYGEDMVVKYVTTEDPDIVEAFYREIIIGLELNKLQSSNFIKTLGFDVSDRCLVPHLTDPGATCIYLYLERIKGVTLEEYIKTTEYIPLLKLFLKILEAYLPALKTYNFTHYDLHRRNIMIRSINGVDEPVFIDFGAAHVSLPHGDLGEGAFMNARYDDRSMWTQDFFKIFGMVWANSSLDLLNVFAKKMALEISEKTAARLNPDEKFVDYVVRILKAHKKLPEDMAPRLLTFKSNLDLLKTPRMQQINQFAFDVLRYFRSDMSVEWLLEYWTHEKYWGSYPTPVGEVTKFESFMKYVSEIVSNSIR